MMAGQRVLKQLADREIINHDSLPGKAGSCYLGESKCNG
jgi:hypothetical protein